MSNERTTVGHCKADSTDTYIGRGPNGRDARKTPIGERGWLGNPYTVENYDRDRSIRLFQHFFDTRMDKDPEFREAVEELAGDTLGCWCQHEDEDSPACHGEVIASYLNGERDLYE